MKFIRDIISEKTRLSAERGAALPHSEANLFQSQTDDQPLESDLDSLDTNPSPFDALDTTSFSDKRSANPVSWDAFASDEKLESDDDPFAMNFMADAGPELEGREYITFDEDAENLFDAVDTMDVEDIESLFHDSVQDVAQPNADEAHNTTDNDLSLGAEPKMDDPREAPMPDPKGVPRYGIENVASPASGETPALPTPQPEQPRAPRAGMNNFVSGLTEMVNVPAPAVGRGAARTGRVKTRLLGFNHGKNAASDPFAKPTQQNSAGFTQYPVGWLIVVDGPGEGSAFTLFDGVSQIGRGSDQTVCLDFGDNSISRENHAVVAYDSENKKFFLGHGGKTNLVRLEDRPVLSTEEMVSGNTIRIGETTLRFVGLCGSDFQWQKTPREDRQNASFS